MIAVCMAISGVPVPALDSTANEWLDFFFRAMAIDRLVDHFKGFKSGVLGMCVSCCGTATAALFALGDKDDDLSETDSPPSLEQKKSFCLA